MIPKELKAYATKWRDQVDEIASDGHYKNLRWAETYIETRLGRVWRDAVGIDTQDEPIVDALNMSPTSVLLVAFYGKAVHRHGTERLRAPALTTWLPLLDRGSERVRFMRAVPKRDIARIVGKSVSAIEDALAKLRGKGRGADVFFERRLAFPCYVDTGIMLDVMTSPQCSFSFMLEDYEYAKAHARECRLVDSPTNFKQEQWCTEAIARDIGTPTRNDASAPGEEALSS